MADTTTANVKQLYKDNEDTYGKKIVPKPIPGTEIGIDTTNDFYEVIASEGDAATVDINRINAFF